MVAAAEPEVMDGGAGALIDMGASWLRGWSQKNGQTFYIVASRTEVGVSHYTTEYGCTCKGFRYSRLKNPTCFHLRAVQEYNYLTDSRWGQKDYARTEMICTSPQ